MGACGSPGFSSTAQSADCPDGGLRIVVTVDQWADLVGRLARPCDHVRTIITGATGDPHDYEPTPADLAAVARADLLVENGLGYDAWADKAVAALGTPPTVVDAGDVGGRTEGDNPHVWYDPAVVRSMADAVTARLEQLRPGATGTLRANRVAFDAYLRPYDAEIETIGSVQHARYAATESVFDAMAGVLGLEDVTPPGYRRAVANEAEPGPADIAQLHDLLSSGEVDLLIFNTQTEGAVPKQLRSTAERAGVPVVEVTETVAPGATGFVDWQVGQLHRVAAALGVR